MSDSRLAEIHDDVKEIRKVQTKMATEMSRSNAILEHQVKRLDHVEGAVKRIRDEDLPEISSHMDQLRGARNLVMTLSLIAGLVYTLVKLL